MFVWYGEAAVCYAYLDDVPTKPTADSDGLPFKNTLWATRGWTLQELLAPSKVIFYARDWTELGNKVELSSLLAQITGIDEEFLTKKKPLEAAGIAKRMSWASRRVTTRPEDIAYCLLGIFSVNMPMLYGEGYNKAFLRLQEEIMRVSDDHSLFAWVDKNALGYEHRGLLASHPSCFKKSNCYIPYHNQNIHEPYSMTNKGLRIALHLSDPVMTADQRVKYTATLNCPVPPFLKDSSFLAVHLVELPGENSQYARVNAYSMPKLQQRGQLKTIYVRQHEATSAIDGIFPTHAIQLRRTLIRDPKYRVSSIVEAPHKAPAIQCPKQTQDWMPWYPKAQISATRIMRKEDTALVCALHIVWCYQGFWILIGSMVGNRVGSCLAKADEDSDFTNLRRLYTPSPLGSDLELWPHTVRITAEVKVVTSAKYYLIDIRLDNPVDSRVTALDQLDGISLSRHTLEEQGAELEKLGVFSRNEDRVTRRQC